MDRHTRLSRFAPLAVLASLGLAGCQINDAMTVHPLAGALDPVPDVPALAGKWVWLEEDGDLIMELQLEGTDARRERCRDLAVALVIDGDPQSIGESLCLFELDGRLVAEVRSADYPNLYRQFLVDVTDDRVQVCAADGQLTVWNQLDALKKHSTVGYAFDDLELTVTESGSGDTDELIVVISEAEAMRGFLAVALPELAAACDEGLKTVGGDFSWIPFEKLTPEEEQARAEAEDAEEE